MTVGKRMLSLALALSLCLTMVVAPVGLADPVPDAKDIGTLTVAAIPDQFANQITGATPDVVITDGEYTLVAGKDYTLSYVNNFLINKQTAVPEDQRDEAETQPLVIVTAIDGSGYTGTIEMPFDIVLRYSRLIRTAPDPTFPANTFTDPYKDVIYPQVSYGNTNFSSSNAVIARYLYPTNASADLATTDTGTPNIATLTVTIEPITDPYILTTGSDTLCLTRATVTGTGDYAAYSGTTGIVRFIVKPFQDFHGTLPSTIKVNRWDDETQTSSTALSSWNPLYTGAALTPTLNVYIQPGESPQVIFTEGVDYTLTYEPSSTRPNDNINVSSETSTTRKRVGMYFVFTTDYFRETNPVSEAPFTSGFTIQPRSLDGSVPDGQDDSGLSLSFGIDNAYEFTGEVINPEPVVKIGDTVLPETDYTVSYGENTALGDTGSVTITATERTTDDEGNQIGGNLSGEVTIEFDIVENEAIAIEGANRYGTAAAAALEAYPEGADGVIIATGVNYPDALSVAGLAGMLDYPILLTDTNALSPETEDAIVALDPEQIITVGGTGAVSAAVQYNLGYLVGYKNLERLSGADRYATAQAIYEYGKEVSALDPEDDIEPWSDTAIFATGNGYADALAISPYSASSVSPIFLLGQGGIDEATLQTIEDDEFASALIAGGAGVVSEGTESALKTVLGDDGVIRLSGDDRYATSIAIADWLTTNAGVSWNGVGIATGANFPDALVGSALLGKNNTVLLLVHPNNTAAIDTLAANKSDIHKVYFLGGTGAISNDLRFEILSALGWTTDPVFGGGYGIGV